MNEQKNRALFKTGAIGAWHPRNFEIVCNVTGPMKTISLLALYYTVALVEWNNWRGPCKEMNKQPNLRMNNQKQTNKQTNEWMNEQITNKWTNK